MAKSRHMRLPIFCPLKFDNSNSLNKNHIVKLDIVCVNYFEDWNLFKHSSVIL